MYVISVKQRVWGTNEIVTGYRSHSGELGSYHIGEDYHWTLEQAALVLGTLVNEHIELLECKLVLI